MTPAPMLEEARRLLATAAEAEAAAIPDNADMENLEAWTSIAHLRLVLAIEELLAIQLTPEDAVAIVSLADIAGLLARQKVAAQ